MGTKSESPPEREVQVSGTFMHGRLCDKNKKEI